MAESTLTKIQNELKAPKGQHNKFGNYDYRSAEDILEALKPLLAKHNAQLTLTDKPVMVGEWHYIEATARLVVDGNEIANTASARESPTKKGMDDSQITGTASSYARKYALNGLFLIDDTKDADTNEYQKNTKRTTRSAKQSASAKKENALSNFKVVYAQYVKNVGKEKATAEYNLLKEKLKVDAKPTDAQLNKLTIEINKLMEEK
jgi:hypothetical protein